MPGVALAVAYGVPAPGTTHEMAGAAVVLRPGSVRRQQAMDPVGKQHHQPPVQEMNELDRVPDGNDHYRGEYDDGRKEIECQLSKSHL